MCTNHRSVALIALKCLYESSAVEHYGGPWLFDETSDDLELLDVHNSSLFPFLSSHSIFRLFIVAQNLPYPILCDHCPIMQWEMPPATTIYVCVWRTLLNCDHTTNTFSFILSDETPWPSGSVALPHVLSESGKTNLLGLTWARQAFCWGSGTEQCQLITGWWILPPTAHLSAPGPMAEFGSSGSYGPVEPNVKLKINCFFLRSKIKDLLEWFILLSYNPWWGNLVMQSSWKVFYNNSIGSNFMLVFHGQRWLHIQCEFKMTSSRIHWLILLFNPFQTKDRSKHQEKKRGPPYLIKLNITFEAWPKITQKYCTYTSIQKKLRDSKIFFSQQGHINFITVKTFTLLHSNVWLKIWVLCVC